MPKFLSTLKGFDGYTATSLNGKIKLDYTTSDVGEDEVLVNKTEQAFKGSDAYEDYLVEGWKPYMRLAPVNEEEATGVAYTTQQLTAKISNSKTPWMPKFFVNPMQDMDYMIYEGLAKNTFVGPLINAYTRFVIGTGFRPELELIHPEDYSDDQKQKLIADNQDIIKSLNEIDRHFNVMSGGVLNTPLVELVSMLVDSMFTFNRSALIFAYDPDKMVEVNGKKFKEIPTHLRYAHPRELGIIEVDPDTWDLQSVQWQYAMTQVPMKDMIYLWDPLTGAKYRDSMYYGGSVITPMADAARVIRQLVGDDFPAMARSTWAGMPIIVIKPKGSSVSEKEAEFGNIVRRFVRGAPNILVYDPEDVDVHQIDFTPKVEEFRKLLDSLHRLCVADVGMPQTMFFDETTSTRSTMLGKIQLAMSTVINPVRARISRQFSPQWYDRWFRLVYKGDPRLKIFSIKMQFDDLHIEKWFDKIESVNMMDGRQRLKDNAYGDMAGVENYVAKVDPAAKVAPGGDTSLLQPTETPDGRQEIRKKEAA